MNYFKKLNLFVLIMTLSAVVLMGCNSQTNEKNSAKDLKQSEETAKVKEITTKELSKNIDSDNWIIVDTRINDAYNGWIIDGVKRSGHIKGAVDFAANWLDVDNKNKDKLLDETLKLKKISPEKNIVVYDSNGKDAKKVANYLSTKGYNNLFTYNVNEWANDKSLAMESYPNYEKIVPATWIKDTIDNNNNNKPYKVFEVSWGDEASDYKKGHIKGATHINTDEVEEAPLWNRLSDQKLDKFATNNGITKDTTVILYGADPMASYRVAAILKYMGTEDVRVLNGGYDAWLRAGYEQETTVNKKQPVKSFGTTVPANPNYIVDMPKAKEILADKKGSTLVDIRSWDEHIGKTSGYDYIKPKGRPAGAVWGDSGSTPNSLEAFRNIDNTMKNGYEIESTWKDLGINRDKNLSFFCGTGWRAAEVITYTDVLGFKNTSLYDGGWNEWSSDPSNPVETGDPKTKK